MRVRARSDVSVKVITKWIGGNEIARLGVGAVQSPVAYWHDLENDPSPYLTGNFVGKLLTINCPIKLYAMDLVLCVNDCVT
jgi:hypothetical protein